VEWATIIERNFNGKHERPSRKVSIPSHLGTILMAFLISFRPFKIVNLWGIVLRLDLVWEFKNKNFYNFRFRNRECSLQTNQVKWVYWFQSKQCILYKLNKIEWILLQEWFLNGNSNSNLWYPFAYQWDTLSVMSWACSPISRFITPFILLLNILLSSQRI